MKISMDVDVKQLNANLERTLVRVRRERVKVVKAEAEEILQESREQVPTDTGTLRDSGFIEEQPDGSYIVGYGQGGVNPKSGAPAEDYMVKIHEDLTLYHQNGKAKFLEDPVNAHAAKLEASLGAKLQKAFSRL